VNRIIAWFRSKNITAHTIAALLVSAATAVATDEQVRSFLVGAFQAHPKVASTIIALAGITLKYSHSSSAAGAIVAGRAALDSPSAPTSAQVAAADPTLK
jgi:hypothetical protein